MVKQKNHTCITQSGKNYAINSAIQGVPLIWKQKIWLTICKFLWSLTNQNAWFVSSFCTELTIFCTVFEKNCTALNQSKWRNFFMYTIRSEILCVKSQLWFQIKIAWPDLKVSFYIVMKMYNLTLHNIKSSHCFSQRRLELTSSK